MRALQNEDETLHVRSLRTTLSTFGGARVSEESGPNDSLLIVSVAADCLSIPHHFMYSAAARVDTKQAEFNRM